MNSQPLYLQFKAQPVSQSILNFVLNTVLLSVSNNSPTPNSLFNQGMRCDSFRSSNSYLPILRTQRVSYANFCTACATRAKIGASGATCEFQKCKNVYPFKSGAISDMEIHDQLKDRIQMNIIYRFEKKNYQKM